MATAYPFAATVNQPFAFQPTLDGVQYTGVVRWNPAAQRWQLALYETTGNALAFAGPVFGSSAANPLSLVKGFFSTVLWYDFQNSQFVTL